MLPVLFGVHVVLAMLASLSDNMQDSEKTLRETFTYYEVGCQWMVFMSCQLHAGNIRFLMQSQAQASHMAAATNPKSVSIVFFFMDLGINKKKISSLGKRG